MIPLTLILFTTSTCVHCKPMKQYLKEFQEQYGERDLFTKILEVDTNPSDRKIAGDWQIKAVPTLVVIQNAEAQEPFVGSMPKEQLGEIIERCLQSDILQESSGGSESTSDSVLRNTSQPTNI